VLIDRGGEIRAEPVGGGPELLVEVAEKGLGVGHERKRELSYQPTHLAGR
jgi:hypothetical protein